MIKNIFLLLVCFTIQAQAQNSKNEELHNFFHSGISAFNNHDLNQFLQQFSPNIEMYSPTGWLRGKEAVRVRFKDTFEKFPQVNMEVEDLKVRMLTSNVYAVDFKWRVFPLGQGPAFHGIGTGIYLFENGKWQEVLEHETVTKTDPELIPKRKENSPQ